MSMENSFGKSEQFNDANKKIALELGLDENATQEEIEAVQNWYESLIDEEREGIEREGKTITQALREEEDFCRNNPDAGYRIVQARTAIRLESLKGDPKGEINFWKEVLRNKGMEKSEHIKTQTQTQRKKKDY